MWLYILSQFLQTPPMARKSKALYLSVSFCIMALSCGNGVVGSIALFDILFKAQPTNALEGLQIWAEEYSRVGIVGDLLADLAIWVADALLVYRCYVICFDCAWVAAIPASIYIANLGLSIKGYSALWGNGDNRFKAATVFLVAINNIVLTALMSWRLLQGHRQLTERLPMAKHKLYTGAVAVLVESAAPIAVCGLGLGLVTAVQDHLETGYALTVFTCLFHTTIALCPQIIIFRVATGKSQAHRSQVVSGEIRFARNPHDSSTETNAVA
ncbi:hypothetical protein BKA70DRAFT_1268113 [Coprinopsis sp. MPI-PUGE-AT-0042]|nr:hypothetical protein BKA70DRAFT_1268113 [Coprinopsis sp. MPI-PUGE-AT-0042]